MSTIRIEATGKDISLTPIEIVMRDETQINIKDDDFSIIVNQHPTDCTHWVLTFVEFFIRFSIDNKAMSTISIEATGKDISLTPIEIVMRDETQINIKDDDFSIIVNQHPTDCTHWVLVIRREGDEVY